MRSSLVVLLLFSLSLADGVQSRRGDRTDANEAAPTTSPQPVSSLQSQSSAFSPPASPTTSSSSPASLSPSSTPISFKFNTPHNTTTCEPQTFVWAFSGIAGSTITLVVTSVPNKTPTTTTSSQSDSDNSTSAPSSTSLSSSSSPSPSPSLISRTIATNISVDNQVFTWIQVDVPPGQYVINATDFSSQTPGVLVPAPFFVVNGSNMSCLEGNDGEGPPASTSSSTGTSATPMGSSHGPFLRKADLIGIIVSTVVAFFALSTAYFYPRWWRKDLHSYRKSPRRYILY